MMNVDDALQHCLEELDAGRLTIAECAALYPHLEDLPAQLAAAQALRAEPAPEFSSAASAALKARLLAQWQARANGHAVEPAVPSAVERRPERMAPPRQRAWRWPRLLTPRLALALSVVVVLLAVSAGTLSAAGSSLPGQLLYPVKRSVETWQIAWTPAADRAHAHLQLVDERARELQALANRPATDPALLAAAADDFAKQCAAALGSVTAAPAGEREALLEAIIAAIADEEAALLSVIAQAPAPAVPALTEALAQSQAQYDLAVLALETVRAGTETPPGQTQVPPGQTNVPPGQTQVPPGQTRRPDQTNPPPGQTRVPPGQTKVPPGQTNIPPGQQTETPETQTTPPASATLVPGQANKTATRTPRPTFTPHPTNLNQGGGSSGPNCSAPNPNSPNYCTPTPSSDAPPDAPPPTACPTNPGGQPKCN